MTERHGGTAPVIALDVGRSRCRAAVVHLDRKLPAVGAVVTVPSAGTLADPDGPTAVAETVATVVGKLDILAGGSVHPLVVAAAGGLFRSAGVEALARRLAADRSGRVVVTSDVVAAHAGAMHGRAGVVLAVGSGAVAFAVGADGGHTVVDGGGWLVGDAGGGFAIGRAGLAAALRHADGRAGGSAALAAAATARFALPGGPSGGGTVREVVGALHRAGSPVREVASFAPDVATAARAGDPVAVAIWDDAVRELADSVNAADGGGTEVVLVGALFAHTGDLLTDPLRRRLADRHPRVTVATRPAQVLIGAAQLATRPAETYRPLLVTVDGHR